MEMKKMLAVFAAMAMAVAVTGCTNNEKNTEPETSKPAETTEAPTEEITESPTEEPTEEELIPPSPAECDDPNALTFDDGDFSFAQPKLDDVDSAQGILSVEEVQGNKMLKFNDAGTNFADGTVQKIMFDAAKLLTPENLAKVRSIEMDVYADATADNFKNDNGDNVMAPGWIGGGGGANVADDVWYEFAEWEGGEYNFEMSGAAHVEMKFLLALGGQCWNETMEEATFQIMRWGAQNEGNLYVDNIVFKDEDGNSLPIDKAAPTEEPTEAATAGNLAR